MSIWKTPDDYISDRYDCDYETRNKVGCTEQFYEIGKQTSEQLDHFGKYQILCKNCSYFKRDVGFYFADGKFSNGFDTKETVVCKCKISKYEQLNTFINTISKTVKAILFESVQIDNLAPLKILSNLECVIINHCPKLINFWDFKKTPHLKVLKYTGNKHLTNLDEIKNAHSLEYFEIDILTSQTKFNRIDTFAPLANLKHLKELVLRGVACKDDGIENLINIENLQKLWISPNTFSVESFTKFESLKFKIYEEYGIFKNGDYSCPLGKGQRQFRSQKTEENFKKAYGDLISFYKKH